MCDGTAFVSATIRSCSDGSRASRGWKTEEQPRNGRGCGDRESTCGNETMTLSLMELDDVQTPTCNNRLSCYRLGLANGLTWHLVTTEQSEQWIARIAAVMKLKRGDAADLTGTLEGAGSVRGESALLAPAPGRRAKRMRHGALTIDSLRINGTSFIRCSL